MTTYDKSKFNRLRFKFKGSLSIERNYSQAYQDMFVLSMLEGKKGGTYLEIGANDPIFISNTYLLQKDFQWNGLPLDIADIYQKSHERLRKNTFVLGDAITIAFTVLLNRYQFPRQIVYLTIDSEP